MNVGASSREGEENEEERIGCSAVCLPFKGRIGGTVRFLTLLLSITQEGSGTDRTSVNRRTELGKGGNGFG